MKKRIGDIGMRLYYISAACHSVFLFIGTMLVIFDKIALALKAFLIMVPFSVIFIILLMLSPTLINWSVYEK